MNPPPVTPETEETAEVPASATGQDGASSEDRVFDVDVVTNADHEEVAPPAVPPEHATDQFQMIVPTLHDSHDSSNSGGLRFNFANRTVGSVRGVLEECVNRGFTPEFWNKKPPEIWLYLPSKEYLELHGKAAAQEVLENFQAVYPGSRPRIVMAIANTRFTEDYLAAELRQSLDAITENEEGLRERLAPIRNMIDGSLERTKALKNTKFYVSAVTSNKVKFYAAFARAGILGGIRAFQFAPAFALGPKATAVALSAIAFDAGVEIYTALLSQQIQTFFMRNPNLGFIQRQAWAPHWLKHPSVDSLVGLLTSGAWNSALFIGFRATVMQSAQALAVPGNALPTLASSWDSLKKNAPGIGFNWFWVKGYNTLKDKGRLSGASVNVFLQVLSLTDVGIGVANSSSDEEVKNIRNWLLPVQWGVYVGTFAYSLVASKNANRILMVHNKVVEEAARAANEANQNKPRAANDDEPFTVSKIGWLNLEQSGLRSLWTIPDDSHNAEMEKVVDLFQARATKSNKKRGAAAPGCQGNLADAPSEKKAVNE